MDYQEFLSKKRVRFQGAGFDVSLDDINPATFGFQKAIIQAAVRLGKFSLFEECGLGKTLQELEWARLVTEHTGGKALLFTHLGVARQVVREAAKFGYQVKYCRTQPEAEAAEERIIVTNYDMHPRFHGPYFAGVVLDESSILKNYTGKIKQTLLKNFSRSPFLLCATATPAPNDHLELGNHAQFLGVMDSNEMISRWFINDSMKAGGYRLKRHAEKDFWAWVASWSVCISRPSDLGYPDDGFVLPELKIHEHIVEVDHARAFAQGRLILDGSLSATQMWAEKRATIKERCERATQCVESAPDDYWIVWAETNDEADMLRQMLPHAIEVRGSDSLKSKEEKLEAFSEGKERIIITKLDIAGFGLNWQHCRNQIFVSGTFSYERLYQGLRRSWRYGVEGEVNAHMIYAESEGNILQSIQKKQEAHREMQAKMNEVMRENGLSGVLDYRPLQIVQVRKEEGDGWQLYLGDCVDVARRLGEGSMDFSVFSPPFSNLYIYSDGEADMGNSADHKEFFQHYGFLAKELFRITRAGRLCAIHCKDLPLYMNRDGAAGLYDFPGDVREAMEHAGWTYHSRVTIWKDPVIEMQRTKNHGLLWKNFSERGEVCRQGMADYILVFRKWADGMPDKQIQHAPKPGEYIGTSEPESFDSERDYSIQVWQRYASPVWFDIQQTNVLNHKLARSAEDEKHICPLQLDVIERCVWLWSNPGEVVFSPFAGIGSEGYVALKMKRRFVGVELKESYWDVARDYLAKAAFDANQPTLFDLAV